MHLLPKKCSKLCGWKARSCTHANRSSTVVKYKPPSLYLTSSFLKIFPSHKFYNKNWANTKGGWNVHCPIKPMLSQKLDSSIQFLQLDTIEIFSSISIFCKELFCTCVIWSGAPCYYPPGASRISNSDNQMYLLILPSALWYENITPG